MGGAGGAAEGDWKANRACRPQQQQQQLSTQNGGGRQQEHQPAGERPLRRRAKACLAGTGGLRAWEKPGASLSGVARRSSGRALQAFLTGGGEECCAVASALQEGPSKSPSRVGVRFGWVSGEWFLLPLPKQKEVFEGDGRDLAALWTASLQVYISKVTITGDDPTPFPKPIEIRFLYIYILYRDYIYIHTHTPAYI